MELQLVEKGLGYARKRKKLILILCAVGFTGYSAYRVYHAPSIARKRKRLFKILGAFVSVAESVSESAETIRVVSRDMKDFLQSDLDEIPNSLKQISKLARSQHFSDSLVSVTSAVTIGVLRGYHQSVNRSDNDQTGAGSSFVDMVVDKLFTAAGSGFASVVVGSFARNMVLAFYSDGQCSGESNSSNATCVTNVVSNSNHVNPTWVDVVCSDKCSELIGNCVQLFVSTAVALYLDKTMHINPYDDFFSGLTNPKHETQVRDVLVSVCNGGIDTLVKTSHKVLTSSPSCLDNGERPARNEESGVETSRSVESKSGYVSDVENDSGWVSKVSSTLAVPSNRRLVLDMTGRVTFETVRSFMEFIFQTFCASVKRCADIVHEAVIELMRYAAAKSSVVFTICLSLCLHIMGGSDGWALVNA
ncbi:hypothetical protein TanjilG_25905 [Lupinus angustifolius]|uniref:Protein PHLOEM PROTEIN 2-LIKE A10 n=1 Tax=Lupinus angustifolius TaxID=3871 RepID=A0A1J7GK17_LUPAN|nr:PREDICTED: protein PHLOEM PROTEIN 2-LIKE A10-like [Lupinus angustifolius]OIV94681.1 hypothetical protein TanjilG_25905 [Lupinus angustifolius]